MFSEGVREIFLEGAEEHGWLKTRDEKIAKKMLMRGVTVEDVAEIMEIPFEAVAELQRQVQMG